MVVSKCPFLTFNAAMSCLDAKISLVASITSWYVQPSWPLQHTFKQTKPQRYICLDHWHMSHFFQNSLTRENKHFEQIDSAAILSLQKGSGAWDWNSIFACSPKANSEPLTYICHPSIDSIPVNSFKQEGSPTPQANIFHYIQLTLICHLLGQEASFVRSLTRNPFLTWNTA